MQGNYDVFIKFSREGTDRYVPKYNDDKRKEKWLDGNCETRRREKEKL